MGRAQRDLQGCRLLLPHRARDPRLRQFRMQVRRAGRRAALRPPARRHRQHPAPGARKRLRALILLQALSVAASACLSPQTGSGGRIIDC
ncbi:protein of unknown function [Methylorubrum extorquens]|uniref:Uncharacterized protein n=1 Tax=Methylorubrum extorquens TaxID=408 RepID=A0A2N9ARE1_METEX|nr:protein of unknown function [Methylorubrum extorquens]